MSLMYCRLANITRRHERVVKPAAIYSSLDIEESRSPGEKSSFFKPWRVSSPNLYCAQKSSTEMASSGNSGEDDLTSAVRFVPAHEFGGVLNGIMNRPGFMYGGIIGMNGGI